MENHKKIIGKLTISMAISNGYVTNYQKVYLSTNIILFGPTHVEDDTGTAPRSNPGLQRGPLWGSPPELGASAKAAKLPEGKYSIGGGKNRIGMLEGTIEGNL